MDRLELGLLGDIVRERQAAMRREARNTELLGDRRSGSKVPQARFKRTLAAALAGAVLVALWLQ